MFTSIECIGTFVALGCIKYLGIEHEITNVNGGAIAMSHPLSVTAEILVRAILDELERRKLKRTIVFAGGMSSSFVMSLGPDFVRCGR